MKLNTGAGSFLQKYFKYGMFLLIGIYFLWTYVFKKKPEEQEI
jgi:hypothetical protein